MGSLGICKSFLWSSTCLLTKYINCTSIKHAYPLVSAQPPGSQTEHNKQPESMNINARRYRTDSVVFLYSLYLMAYCQHSWEKKGGKKWIWWWIMEINIDHLNRAEKRVRLWDGGKEKCGQAAAGRERKGRWCMCFYFSVHVKQGWN